VISIGIVSEYRASFDAPHHDVTQVTRSVDSRSPWHATPLPLSTTADNFIT
jgi:hypothetical protein